MVRALFFTESIYIYIYGFTCDADVLFFCARASFEVRTNWRKRFELFFKLFRVFTFFQNFKLQRLSPSSSSSYPSGDASSNLFLLFTSFLSFRLLVSFDVGVVVFPLLLGGHESELLADEH
jgi:hypothetical protein